MVVGDCAFAKHEAGVGVGPKPATELLWLGCGHAMQDGGGGLCVGWYGGAYEVMVVGGGLCAHKTRGGGGGLGQNQQPSCRGSVAGAPCETAAGDGV